MHPKCPGIYFNARNKQGTIIHLSRYLSYPSIHPRPDLWGQWTFHLSPSSHFLPSSKHKVYSFTTHSTQTWSFWKSINSDLWWDSNVGPLDLKSSVLTLYFRTSAQISFDNYLSKFCTYMSFGILSGSCIKSLISYTLPTMFMRNSYS